jgi:hypothetical protein
MSKMCKKCVRKTCAKVVQEPPHSKTRRSTCLVAKSYAKHDKNTVKKCDFLVTLMLRTVKHAVQLIELEKHVKNMCKKPNVTQGWA